MSLKEYFKNRKIKKQKEEEYKQYNKQKNHIMNEYKESELIIKHYLGYERGGLFLISYDIQQLTDLKDSLESRGYKCDLFENFVGMHREFKIELMSRYKHMNKLEYDINHFLEVMCDKYFMNGRPIPSYDFFNDKEKEILNKWWKGGK